MLLDGISGRQETRCHPRLPPVDKHIFLNTTLILVISLGLDFHILLTSRFLSHISLVIFILSNITLIFLYFSYNLIYFTYKLREFSYILSLLYTIKRE